MRVKNWNQFQHFKDRRPPWIKLYRDLLDDMDWHELDPVSAKALVMIWLIASENDGQLPEAKKLAFRLRMTEKQTVQLLNSLYHWLEHDDISVISERNQDDVPETETEGETETNADALVVAGKPAPCPHQKIIELYAQNLPTLPYPRIWEGQRQQNLAARWRWVLTAKKPDGAPYATDSESALSFFDRFFAYVAKSDFLTGRDGKWQNCDLGWLVKAENFAKVMSGNYENKEAA